MKKRKGYQQKLAIRTITVFVASVVLLYLIAGVLFYYVNLKELDEDFGKKLIKVAETASDEVSPYNLNLLNRTPLSEAVYNRLARKLAPIMKASDIDNITILSRNNKAVFDLKNREMIGVTNPYTYAYMEEIENAFKGKLVYSPLYRGRDGHLYKSAFAPLMSNRKTEFIIAIEANPQFLQMIDEVLKWIAISGAASLCVTVFLSLLFANKVVKKIRKLEHVATQINDGNFNVSIAPGGSDEIDQLAETFNNMIKSISRKIETNARLATIGEMSAGIAHEIRNPLGSIQIYMDILRKKLESNDNEKEICDRVIKEIETLNKFITEFLVFARPPVLDLKNQNIHNLLDELISQLPVSPEKDNINIIKKYCGENHVLKIDREQIKRALLNIFINSIEALKGNGDIIVETGKLTEHPEIQFEETGRENEKNNDYFYIKIKDNGQGINKQDLNKIFDPFFSTKDTGTGLGLSIAHKIIKEHNGYIKAFSSGAGTEIAIALPLVDLTLI